MFSREVTPVEFNESLCPGSVCDLSTRSDTSRVSVTLTLSNGRYSTVSPSNQVVGGATAAVPPATPRTI